jgi:ABC-2 type transport system permease protein
MTGLAGTWALVRLGLRRDRIFIPVCVLLLVILVAGSAKATEDLYAQSAADAINATLASPAIVAMYGPLANIADPDSLAIFKTYLLGGIGLALLAFSVVRRHTRTEEEAGRTELLGAAVVGRNAQLAAAVLLAAGATVATGALGAVGLIGSGLGATGAWAFGVGWIAIGLSSTAITAVAAQLTTTSRGCAAWALGAMGVAYVLRAAGDTSTGGLSFLTWLSPFGWAEKIGPYGANRFVVAVIPLLFTAALLTLAGVLLARRDIGAGVLPARPGPASAARSLRSPLGLAWRLHRGALIGWLIAYALLGLALGVVATSVSGMAASESVQQMLHQLGGNTSSLSDAFLSTEMQFLAIGAAAYGISAALRLRSEETDLHTEQVLATAVTRRSVLAGHSLIALAGSAALMIVFGLASAFTYGRQTGGVGTAMDHLLAAALSTVPAVWICVGLALAIVGSMPRIVYLAWGLLAVFVVVGEFGTLLDLPAALIGISPFQHGQVLPGGSPQAAPLLALTAIAAILVVAAGITFRRRDIA